MTGPAGGIDVVVGAGHNGLIAACYLARAGRQVLVLEALDRPGGGSRTEETVPGYRFDLHSAAHNIINMTDIPDDLDLAGLGLDYLEMDPFSIAVDSDGRRVRFYRSVEATIDSITEESPAEAEAYRTVHRQGNTDRAHHPALHPRRRLAPGAARPGRQPGPGFAPPTMTTARDAISPYHSLLQRWLPSDLTHGPVAAFAAHAGVGVGVGVGPTVPGGALLAFWQAAYHLFGQWHGRGGAQNLTDALVARLASLGGEIRCSAPVGRIEAPGRRVRAVVLEGGERIPTGNVITAINPQTALLHLLDPPLGGGIGADLAAARRSNVVQALVHVATDRLPAHPNSRTGDWNGLQSYVDHLDDLINAWNQSEAGHLPDPLPRYAFTPSAIDGSLAPPGAPHPLPGLPRRPLHHQRRLAGPAGRTRRRLPRHPREPGPRDSIQGLATWTPDEIEQVDRWPGGHPMHLTSPSTSSDCSGPPKPSATGAPRSAGSTSPASGPTPPAASPAPPGRQAARTLLSDQP